MTESLVKVSMQDNNDLSCSYAIISKGSIGVIIILKASECAIFDYQALKKDDFEYSYLLLKHYGSDSRAYLDFLKLIGKMCKKEESSKYFGIRKSEDNRMVSLDWEHEHMITDEEKVKYNTRFLDFQMFILKSKSKF